MQYNTIPIFLYPHTAFATSRSGVLSRLRLIFSLLDYNMAATFVASCLVLPAVPSVHASPSAGLDVRLLCVACALPSWPARVPLPQAPACDLVLAALPVRWTACVRRRTTVAPDLLRAGVLLYWRCLAVERHTVGVVLPSSP